MEYFKYAMALDTVRAREIFAVVQGLEPFAKKKYKGKWEDAIDATFMHVLRNYDENSGGNLEHYATSVMSKILLNSFKKETGSETQLLIESDKKAVQDEHLSNPEYILTEGLDDRDDSLKDCIQYLIPRFLKDYEVWKKKQETDKSNHEDYTGIFKKYKPAVIKRALDYLVANYYDDAVYLSQLAKGRKMRRFSKDRYKNSLDLELEYQGTLNGIVLVHFKNQRLRRVVYSVDIQGFINKLVDSFYKENSVCCKNIAGNNVYVTLSGYIAFGLEELKEQLETEIVGAIFARSVKLHCLHYDFGSMLLVTSSREIETSVFFDMFGSQVMLDFKRLVLKRV